MSYEIKTPLLARSADIAERVAEAVLAGEMSSKEGSAAIYGARVMQGAVKTEIDARLTTLRVAAAIRAAMWRGGLRGRSKRKIAAESKEAVNEGVMSDDFLTGDGGAIENDADQEEKTAA